MSRRWPVGTATAFAAFALSAALIATPSSAAAASSQSTPTFTGATSARALSAAVRPGTRRAFSVPVPRSARGAYLTVHITRVKSRGTVKVCGVTCPKAARIKVSRKRPVVRTVFVPINADHRAVIRSSAKAKVVTRAVGYTTTSTAPRVRKTRSTSTVRNLAPRRTRTVKLTEAPAKARAVVLRIKTSRVRKSGTIKVCSVRDRSAACRTAVRAVSTKGRTQTTTTVVPLKGARHLRLRSNSRAKARITIKGYVVPATSTSKRKPPKPDPITNPVTNPGEAGVPDGTKLTPHHGNLTITKPGTVISNLEVFGRVSIKAANVTIKNSRIRAQEPTKSGIVNSKSPGVVIQDTEIFSDHDNTDVNGIMGWGFTLQRVEIHSVVDQVHIHGDGNVTIVDSDFHSNIHWEKDPNWGGKPTHDDNVQIVSGSDITVSGTTFSGAHSAAVMFSQDSGTISRVTLRDNVIGGGACSVNVAPKSRGPITGLHFVNNAFIRNQTKMLGCAVIAPNSSRPVMTDNVWKHSGDVVAVTRG